MTTAYDEVIYPGKPFRQTHPDRLAAHAMLFGLPCAPIGRCRVLDIGAGDGANLIPMAVSYPEAEFVGFDLAGTAVGRGQSTIDALEMGNIRLRQADILDVDLGREPFDYIIAHGVYSWVPAPVRRALLALISRCLAPHGVAFVSYNALPGCRVRQALRDMLLFDLRNIEGATARAEAGRRRLNQIAIDFPEHTPFQALLKDEARQLRERSLGVMAHDELGAVYHPLHLHEFIADCAGHGLQFLTEAEPSRCGEGFLPPYALDDPDFDLLAHAQDMDFKAARSFRQSLVVRDDIALSRRPRPERLRDMHVSSPARRNEAGAFETGAATFEVTDEVLAGAVARIGAAWPATLPIGDLITDEPRAGALLRMYWAGTVELHAAASNFLTAAGERPAASPLARLQAERGATHLTTLRHTPVDVEDPFSLAFIAGLDGSRTRAQMARDLSQTLGTTAEIAATQIDANLNVLAHMPLLVQ